MTFSVLYAVSFLLATTIQACELGWLRQQDKCYMFSHVTGSWAEAQSICNAFRGAKLAEPKIAAESAFLSSHSQGLGKTFWIGVSDILQEDRWIYPSNLHPINVTNWAPNEPGGHTRENCVLLYLLYNGKWVDAACHSPQLFICELENTDGEQIIG